MIAILLIIGIVTMASLFLKADRALSRDEAARKVPDLGKRIRDVQVRGCRIVRWVTSLLTLVGWLCIYLVVSGGNVQRFVAYAATFLVIGASILAGLSQNGEVLDEADRQLRDKEAVARRYRPHH